VGDDAADRLAQEESFLPAIWHDGYRNHFRPPGRAAGSVVRGCRGRGGGEAQAALAAYAALDVAVVFRVCRAVPLTYVRVS